METQDTTQKENGTLGLHSLIEAMLQESFAQSCHFDDMTLESVGKEIEQTAEIFTQNGQAAAPAEWAAQKPSYDRVVELYCQILMEYDRFGMPLPETPLGTLVTPTPVPPPSPSEPLSPKELNTLDDIAEAEQTLTQLNIPETPPAIPVTPAPAADDLTAQLSSPVAREHLELAHYFDGVKEVGSFPFATHHINRFTDQSLCFCVESECSDKMSARLAKFWTEREQAVRALLDPSGKKFDLHPALKAELDRLAAEHGDWLMDGRFPYAAALTSLRYLAATPSPEKHQTSLLDYGWWLLLFGWELPLEGLRLENQLGATGLGGSQMIEMSFRLTRLYKLRTMVISPTSRLSEPQRLQLQEDVHQLITLMARLTFPANEDQKKVA